MVTVGPGVRQELFDGDVAVGVQLRSDGRRHYIHDDGGPTRSKADPLGLSVLDAGHRSRSRFRSELHRVCRTAFLPWSSSRGPSN